MQADTAVVPELIEERFPFSQVKDANVLVFPSLDAANVAYKLLARLGGAEAIGPILLGMGAPITCCKPVTTCATSWTSLRSR